MTLTRDQRLRIMRNKSATSVPAGAFSMMEKGRWPGKNLLLRVL